VFTQKSNKQHDLIVDRIYAWFDLIKDQHIDRFVFPYRFANRENDQRNNCREGGKCKQHFCNYQHGNFPGTHQVCKLQNSIQSERSDKEAIYGF
jgi:hypothetical protein